MVAPHLFHGRTPDLVEPVGVLEEVRIARDLEVAGIGLAGQLFALPGVCDELGLRVLVVLRLDADQPADASVDDV